MSMTSLKARRAKLSRAIFFFLHRILGAWNALPGLVVERDTIMLFKQLLNRHVDMQGMDGYELRSDRRN